VQVGDEAERAGRIGQRHEVLEDRDLQLGSGDLHAVVPGEDRLAVNEEGLRPGCVELAGNAQIRRSDADAEYNLALCISFASTGRLAWHCKVFCVMGREVRSVKEAARQPLVHASTFDRDADGTAGDLRACPERFFFVCSRAAS
jgi:hypothetical protein